MGRRRTDDSEDRSATHLEQTLGALGATTATLFGQLSDLRAELLSATARIVDLGREHAVLPRPRLSRRSNLGCG